MKKAQILCALGLMVVLGLATPSLASATTGAGSQTAAQQTTKPSLAQLISATSEAKAAIADAYRANDVELDKLAKYLNGYAENGVKAQSDYASWTAADLDELVNALNDGVFYIRIKLYEKSAALKTAATPVAAQPKTATAEPTVAKTSTSEPATAKATASQNAPQQAIAHSTETPKIILATPAVITQVSTPNTSAGKVSLHDDSAQATFGFVNILAALTVLAGIMAKTIKVKSPKRLEVVRDAEN